MNIRFFVLLFLGISLFLFQCESSPTSSNSDDDPIDNPDNSGDDGSDDEDDDDGDEEPEITIIEIPNTYSAFYPYQSLIYYSDEFDIEDYGFEFVNGVDPEDSEYDLYKRFDLVYYQDTLAVGDTLSAKVKEWGQWSITIPRIEPGSYTFKVILRDDLLLTGEAEILSIGVINDPANFIHTEFSEFRNQMSMVLEDARKVIDNVPEHNIDSEIDDVFIERMETAIGLYEELEQKVFIELETASPEQLERLAYYFKAYDELLNEEYESYEESLNKLNDELPLEPEKEYEKSKGWLTNKINFKGILDSFWGSDTENVQVGEGDVVETAKTWHITGWAISIITGIQERFTKVFTLTTDKLNAELKLDSERDKSANFGMPWPYSDSLYFEFGQPTRLSFTGIYENLREDPWDEAPDNGTQWSDPKILNVITGELYDMLDEFYFNDGVLRYTPLFPLMREDTTNISTTINSKYLEFIDASNSSYINFFDMFDVEKDESTGEFIITAKPFVDEQGDTVYGDWEFPIWLQYYQDEEYDEFDFAFFTSSCPDFSLFIPGQWRLRYYTDDTRSQLQQEDRQTYSADGKWTEKEYRFAGESEWRTSSSTGTWEATCSDGNARLIWRHNFFTNIAYVFKYDGDKNQMFGYSSGLSFNGYNLELRKGW